MSDTIPTKEQLIPGARVFISPYWADKVIELEILGPLDVAQGIYDVKNVEGPCISDLLCLADQGYPGHAYDDRPNQVWLTREAAEAGLVDANAWFETLDKRMNRNLEMEQY